MYLCMAHNPFENSIPSTMIMKWPQPAALHSTHCHATAINAISIKTSLFNPIRKSLEAKLNFISPPVVL